MRVFALSDVHVDYPSNEKWLLGLSDADYQADLLILGGDMTDNVALLERSLAALCGKFHRVLFIPGNHELWVVRDDFETSWQKFEHVRRLTRDCGATMDPFHRGGLSIVPMFSWYDFSFGEPGGRLKSNWADFYACVWHDQQSPADISRQFLALNSDRLDVDNGTVISFSHFVPRLDLIPSVASSFYSYLHPVLGSTALGDQVASLGPNIHVYGHSHINRDVVLDGVRFINNAYGYPSETRIASKKLLCIHEA